MKKNIAIIVLSLLTLISGVSSLLNHTEVQKTREANEVLMKEAAYHREQAEECVRQAELASEYARKAMEKAIERAGRTE